MQKQTAHQQLIEEQDRLVRNLEQIKHKARLSGPDAQDAWARLIQRFEKRLNRLQEMTGHSVEPRIDPSPA